MRSCKKHSLVDDGLDCDGLVEDGLVEDGCVEDGVLQIVEDARCCGQCADVEDIAVLYLRHSLCQ